MYCRSILAYFQKPEPTEPSTGITAAFLSQNHGKMVQPNPNGEEAAVNGGSRPVQTELATAMKTLLLHFSKEKDFLAVLE